MTHKVLAAIYEPFLGQPLSMVEAEKIVEAITTCAPYIGYPRTNGSLRAAQSIFDQWGEVEEWKSV